MFLFFDVIYLILLVIYIPILAYKGKLHSGYKARFGIFDNETMNGLGKNKAIWVHAVSVGEVLAVYDLISKLRDKYSDDPIVLTVVTKTGYSVAKDRYSADVKIIYAPLDFSFIVRKYIKLINPKIYILAETEIWPNLFRCLRKQNVSIIQVNGRLSPQSYRGYKRLKLFSKYALSQVTCFCMQSHADADRIISFGINPNVVRVTGNLKFDNLPKEISVSKTDIGLSENDDVIVAGSTHPGEEGIIIESYIKLKEKNNNLRLVICPRHVERMGEIKQIVESYNFQCVQFSNINQNGGGSDAIIVVDTMGQLNNFYSMAKVVFIGKTFKNGGGQNMIEPAFFGKPIIVGPMTYNFKDVVDLLLNEKALVQVNTIQELDEELEDIVGNAVRCESLGMAAKRVVEKYQGATTKTLHEINRLMVEH